MNTEPKIISIEKFREREENSVAESRRVLRLQLIDQAIRLALVLLWLGLLYAISTIERK